VRDSVLHRSCSSIHSMDRISSRTALTGVLVCSFSFPCGLPPK